MKHLIDKAAVVAEINRVLNSYDPNEITSGRYALNDLRKFLNTLEVKEVDTWHLQEKENLYDAINDWNLHTFACIMKDGTIQKFYGSCDEDFEGQINTHIYGVNDDYDNVDDIVKWIEFT